MGKMKAVKNLLLKFSTAKLRSLHVLYSKDPEGQFVGAEWESVTRVNIP